MNRAGANPWRVISQLRSKLRLNAAAVQVPIGTEDGLEGVVDIVRMKAIYNRGEKGSATHLFDTAVADALIGTKYSKRKRFLLKPWKRQKRKEPSSSNTSPKPTRLYATSS